MTELEAMEKFNRTSVLWESATNTEMVEAVKVAIKAMEEVQQYRAIGTVEECRENKEFLEFLYNRINPNDMEQYLSMYHGSGEKIN